MCPRLFLVTVKDQETSRILPSQGWSENYEAPGKDCLAAVEITVGLWTCSCSGVSRTESNGTSEVRQRAAVPCGVCKTEGQAVTTPDCLGRFQPGTCERNCMTSGRLRDTDGRPTLRGGPFVWFASGCVHKTKQAKPRLWKPQTQAGALGCWFHVWAAGST